MLEDVTVWLHANLWTGLFFMGFFAYFIGHYQGRQFAYRETANNT